MKRASWILLGAIMLPAILGLLFFMLVAGAFFSMKCSDRNF